MTQTFVGPAMATLMVLALQAAENSSVIPWWVWFILISLVLLLLLIGFIRQSEPGEPLPKPEERAAAPVVAAEQTSEEPEPEPAAEPVESAEAAPPEIADDAAEGEATGEEAEETEAAQPDDLKRIEGIGPKISSILNDSGITTFAALAATDPDRLQEILDEADIRLAHPATWPEQAGLAAAGKWSELETLQDSLKGGRRK